MAPGSAYGSHDYAIEGSRPPELTFEDLFRESASSSSPLNSLPSTSPSIFPTIDPTLFMTTAFPIGSSRRCDYLASSSIDRSGTSANVGNHVSDGIGEGEGNEAGGDVYQGRRLGDPLNGTEIVWGREWTPLEARHRQSLNTEDEEGLSGGGQTGLQEEGNTPKDVYSGRDVDMMITWRDDPINHKKINTQRADDSDQYRLAQTTITRSPPYTPISAPQGPSNSRCHQDSSGELQRIGLDVVTQLDAVADSIRDPNVPVDRDFVGSKLSAITSTLRSALNPGQSPGASLPAEGDDEPPSKRHRTGSSFEVNMTEDVKPDLGSNLSAEGKRAILTEVHRAYYQSIGMQSTRNNVPRSSGYIDFSVICPDPTPSGRDATDEFWRVDHSDPSNPHIPEWLNEIYRQVEHQLYHKELHWVLEATDFEVVTRGSIERFVKARYKQHERAQEGALLRSKIGTNITKRRRADLQSRIEKWESGPFVDNRHPCAEQLKVLITDMSTVPIKFRYNEFTGFANGAEEYLFYAEQLCQGSKPEKLFAKQYNSNLPMNLVVAVHFFDTWTTLTKSQVMSAGLSADLKTYVLPEVYWTQEPLPSHLCLDQWSPQDDILAMFSNSSDPKVLAALTITSASFPPIHQAEFLATTDRADGTDAEAHRGPPGSSEENDRQYYME